MWHLTACKISVCLSFLNWIKNEMIFYRISELMLASELMLLTLIQKSNFIFYPDQNFTGCQMSHFMIVLIPYINLLNLSWIKKCIFLRNMMPGMYIIWTFALIPFLASFFTFTGQADLIIQFCLRWAPPGPEEITEPKVPLLDGQMMSISMLQTLSPSYLPDTLAYLGLHWLHM